MSAPPSEQLSPTTVCSCSQAALSSHCTYSSVTSSLVVPGRLTGIWTPCPVDDPSGPMPDVF